MKAIVSRDHGVCHVCGHPGANSADHDPYPVTERPDLALDAGNMKAIHTYPVACPTCSPAALARGGKMVFCNELKQGMSKERAQRIIRERTGLSLGLSEGKPRPASGERSWD